MTLLFINIFGWILPSTPYRVYCAVICGNFCTFADISVNLRKGELDAAELAANTYANHICTKHSWIFFFLQIIFFLMLMKEYVFLFLGISHFYINSKKEDDLTSASYLHAGHLLSQAKWSQPFWLTNYNRRRKLLSLET